MSEVILEWLNNEVGLSRKVKAFERDFANGYLFGELLHKRGLIEGFDDAFRDTSAATARVSNWNSLRKALKGSAGDLGIRLKEDQVTEIMNGDRGSSLRLLYQIRQGLRRLSEPPPLKGKPADATRRLPPPQEAPEPFAEFFQNTAIGSLRPGEPRVAYELHSKQFVDEHFRQMRAQEERESQERDGVRRRQVEFRAGRLDALSRDKAAKARTLQEGVQQWNESLERNTRLAETDLNFEKKTIARDRAKVDKIRSFYRHDCGYGRDEELQGIGWFEHNLQRFGLDARGHGGSEAERRPDAAEAPGILELQQRLPTTTQQKVETGMMMSKIKQTTRGNDQARKERARRNHREQVNRDREQAEQALHEGEELLLQRLLRESAEHRAEALAREQELRRKEAAKEQRAERQRAAMAKREKGSEEALARSAEAARAERAALHAERAAEREREEERRRLREASGLAPVAPPSLDDLTSSSEDDDGEEGEVQDEEESPVRQVSSAKLGTVSPKFGRKSSARHSNCGDGPEPLRAAVSVPEMLESARDPFVTEFLFLRGSWAPHRPLEADVRAAVAARCGDGGPAGSEAEAWGPQLGGLVRAMMEPGPTPPPGASSAHLPRDYMPVLMLGGSPVLNRGGGGATLPAALAQRLREEFQLAVVDPRRVAAECLELARNHEQEPEWPVLARMHQIGREVLQLRQECEGEQTARAGPLVVPLPPDLCAEMVFRKIELLSAPPPKPPEVDTAKDKKKPGKKDDKKAGKKSDEEDEDGGARPKGVVVIDFPADAGQLSAWEAALRGYSSPLLRVLDSDADKRLQLSSVLAPWWVEQEQRASSAKVPSAQAPPSPADEFTEPPVASIIRLCPADDDSLRKTVLAQAEDAFFAVEEPAATKVQSKADKGKEVPPPEPEELLVCAGSDEELAALTAPVDRAWLYGDAQVLAEPFAAPLGVQHDVLAPAPPALPQADDEPMEQGEPVDEVCYRRVRELVAARAAREEAAATPCEEVGEDAAQAAEGEGAEVPAEDIPADAQPEPPGAAPTLDAAGCWGGLDHETQARMQQAWNEAMEDYFVSTKKQLGLLRSSSAGWAERLVRMQKQFLEFLQSPDEKEQILDQFLEQWPKNRVKLSQEEALEELDELSEQLWQVADKRRAFALDERTELMEGSFWESEAGACLRLAEGQQRLEADRFRTGARLLFEAHGLEPPSEEALGAPTKQDPGGRSSMSDLSGWLRGSTASLAGGDLALVCGLAVGGDPDDEAANGVERERRERLCSALQAEQLRLTERLMALEGWASTQLKAMRLQLNGAFARMDDWVKERVTAENQGINAMMEQLHATDWSEEPSGPFGDAGRSPALSPAASSHMGGSRRISSLLTAERRQTNKNLKGLIRKLRTELQHAMHPQPLDAELLNPAEASGGAPQPNIRGSLSSIPPGMEHWWTMDMLRGVLGRLAKRGGGAEALAEGAVLEVLVECRDLTLSFESEPIPQEWATRSEECLALLCRSLARPAWGAPRVDVIEFMLTLTIHVRQMAWPSLDVLETSRRALEDQLEADQRLAWPDVPVSEDAFLKLPLLEEMLEGCPADVKGGLGERSSAMKRWLFQILAGFESEGCGGAAAVSARRIFCYLGLGSSPTDGLRRALRLLMPTPHPKGQDEDQQEPPRWRIHDLWCALFGCKGRPAGASAEPPPLANFVKDLLVAKREATPAPDPAGGKVGKTKSQPKAKADAKAKAKPGSRQGGRTPSPTGDEDEDLPPPVPPEEAVAAFEEQALLRHPQVVKGLCSHGALLCRKTRALDALFPRPGDGLLAVLSSQEAAELQGLEALAPPAERGEASEGS